MSDPTYEQLRDEAKRRFVELQTAMEQFNQAIVQAYLANLQCVLKISPNPGEPYTTFVLSHEIKLELQQSRFVIGHDFVLGRS